MGKPDRPGRKSSAGQHVTVYLGGDGRAGLERCTQLLSERSPRGASPSAGLVLRLAVRRLLLALLGERADWSVEGDPVAAEYLDLVELENSLQEIPVRVEVSSGRAHRRPKSGYQPRPRLKGGLE